jgi:hypothetical protein
MKQDRYDKVGFSYHTRWLNNRHFAHFVKATLESVTYYEEEYKGEQIIVIGWHHVMETLLDRNGEPFPHQVSDDEVASYGKPEKHSSFHAYSWEIGSIHDRMTEISWINHCTATLSGVCGSSKQDTTLKSARKKVDLSAKIRDVKDELLAIVNDHIDYGTSKENPYNASVNDLVYIQAFGRLRRGKIVATTGSRFIVGYATPSNSTDLKYKTLPLSQLWIGATK